MNLLTGNRFEAAAMLGIEIMGFKAALDVLAKYTPLYKAFGYLKQGTKFVMGLVMAMAIDLIMEKIAPDVNDDYLLAQAAFYAAFASLEEQLIPTAANPLYLNVEKKALEGYNGTVKAAYMVHDGHVYPIDVSAPAESVAQGLAHYVVVTTNGVYATIAPFVLQYSPMPSPLKLGP